MIPRAHAQFRWRTTDEGPSRVIEVSVFDDRMGPKVDNPDLDNSRGACTITWMRAPWDTPEGLWTELMLEGFFNEDALTEALEQFAQVEGCDWAQRMTEAIKSRYAR
jgi:hypothetical protein